MEMGRVCNADVGQTLKAVYNDLFLQLGFCKQKILEILEIGISSEGAQHWHIRFLRSLQD